MADLFAPGERVHITPDMKTVHQMGRLARVGYEVPDLIGATGTVHEHTRLWSWDESREAEPRITHESVVVILDDGTRTSCQPDWLSRISDNERIDANG